MISFLTLIVNWGRKKKKCDERTKERTDGVTMSLLELLIAAKNIPKYTRFSKKIATEFSLNRSVHKIALVET